MIDSILGLLAALSLVPAPTAVGAPIVRPGIIVPPAMQAAAPKKRRTDSLGVETTGHSVFVADVASGSVLYSKKAHDVMPIASLTKLMTAMVLMDADLDWNAAMTFADSDFNGEGRSVFGVGETITRKEALQALLIGSVNAAGNALARTTLGRDAFVKAMNDKVKSMRLSSPVFVEPTGVDPLNRASAADVAAMLSTALSYPEIRASASLPAVTIKGQSGKTYEIKSTNLLLTSFLNQKPYHIIGAKTGSLPQAGYCMAQVTRNEAGREIVVVNLDSANHFARFQDVKALTAWAFDTYEWNQ